ncbi:MAG: alcohol dehydrogenase, partial [Nitrospirae bacterium]
MRAMAITRIGPVDGQSPPVEPVELPEPTPGPGEVLVRVTCCGVCHTELDEIEGRTPPVELPMVPGHQAVGRIAALGEGVTG